ncbi:uncharacterized protein ACIB01_001562 isoform 1-T1 [Guaruba guarouba]
MAASGGSPARAPTPGSDPPGCCCGDGARSAAGSHSDSLTASFSKVEAQKKPGSSSPLPWHVSQLKRRKNSSFTSAKSYALLLLDCRGFHHQEALIKMLVARRRKHKEGETRWRNPFP